MGETKLCFRRSKIIELVIIPPVLNQNQEEETQKFVFEDLSLLK